MNAEAVRGRSATHWILAAVLALDLFLCFVVGDGKPASHLLLASAILWVSVYPSVRYIRDGKREIPFLPAMALIYFLYYGLPAFTRTLRVGNVHLSDERVDVALLLALTGLIVLLVAFYATRFDKLPRVRLELDLARNAPMLAISVLAFTVLRWVLAFQFSELSLGSLLTFAETLPLVFLAGLYLCHLRGQLSWPLRVTALLLLGVNLLLDWTGGAMAVPVLTLMTLLFIYVHHHQRLPISAILVSAVLIIPSLGVKQKYREATIKHPQFGILERANLFAGLISDVYAPDGRMSFGDAGDVAEERANHLSAFAFVISKTPDQVPYWNGETYKTLLWTPIPRFLYPDKPQKTLGQEYGHRYGFIARTNRQTSINLEQTVEMYANFGPWGVILGMLLMGLVYRLLYSILNHANGGDGCMLIALATFRVLLNIESDFSLVFGGIVQSAILLYLVLRFVAARRSAPLVPEARTT
jgi:hypothetical protein